MWRTVCGHNKKEQAIVLLQSLNEDKKAEKAVSKLTVTDLNVADGLEKLLEKFDSTFKTEKTQELHNVFKDLNKIQQLKDVSIDNYLLEFEHLNERMTQFDLKLPDNILCLKLPESGSLSVNEKQMA